MSIYEGNPAMHIKTYLYKIDTPAGKYMVHLEEYIRVTYVIKFYPVRFKKYPNKYHLSEKNRLTTSGSEYKRRQKVFSQLFPDMFNLHFSEM